MKKIYFLALALCFFTGLNAQVITFNDIRFQDLLLSSSESGGPAKDINGNYIRVDTNNNNLIEESEVLPIAYLKMDSRYLTNLTQISKFINLVELDVTSNGLTALNLTGLNNLKIVKCARNQIKTLNVTGLTKIEVLDCSYNAIPTLDFKDFTALKNLDCSNSSVVALDLTNCTAIKNLIINNNSISVLNVSGFKNLEVLNLGSNSVKTLDTSNLTALNTLTFYGNPLTSLNTANCTALKFISVADHKISDANISGCTALETLDVRYCSIDKLTVENCTALTAISGFDSMGYVTNLNLTNCKNLTAIIMVNFGVKNLNLLNCSALTTLECTKINVETINLSGCSSLKTLVADNNMLQQLDLSDCVNLEKLVAKSNKLTVLKVAGSKLKELSCSNNLLTDLNLSGQSQLVSLSCYENKLANINITGLTSLKTFICYRNLLTNLNVSQLSELQEFDCSFNNLVSLNTSKLVKLNKFSFTNGNYVLADLNVSGCILLEQLIIANPIVVGDFSGCTGLKSFTLTNITNTGFGKLSNLNLSDCTSLVIAEIKSRVIGNLDVSNCSALNDLNVSWGAVDKLSYTNTTKATNLYFYYITFPIDLDLRGFDTVSSIVFDNCTAPNINISNLANLSKVYGLSRLENVNASGCPKLAFYTIDTKNLNLSGCKSLKTLYFDNNSHIETLDITGCSSINDIQVSYKGFKSFQFAGCDMLTKIALYNTLLTNLPITNLPSLENLGVSDSKTLTTVTFSNVPKLKSVSIYDTGVTSLDLKEVKSLETFYGARNQLTNLDIQGLSNIIDLSCEGNKLTTLDTKTLKNIKKLNFQENQISEINLIDFKNLTTLTCSDNKLTELNLTGCGNINYLVCLRNEFTTLDLRSLTKLTTFSCVENSKLTSIFLNNLDRDVHIDFSLHYNPNLQYICVDESRIAAFQKEVYRLGYYTCNVNSYCSFTPNGAFTMLQGNTRLDANNNGCEVSDIPVSSIKFKIKSNLTEGTVISDATGSYSFPIQTGNYEVSPILENPEYFNISPTTLIVATPAETTPLFQDFCLTATNTEKKDLEVQLLPLNNARPGFDSKYKLIYKNKGNVTQSGTVSFKFDDSILDYISSNIAFSKQSVGNIEWNFTNLKPFESREITIVLNTNTPTETPAVNNGDILKFSAAVASQNVDEMPLDNALNLNQTVVGSYDPNDKTCLEGSVITPVLIGEYVHYMIRFENTGSYKAQNIVVKDMIDLTKFDISTLIPTSSSHSFVTKISEGNKVEFIFENINLPFDDASNDGYVAFKIKTKPTLKVGDSFTNDANIYFDYNFPILTNKATSTFKTLATQDFEFSNYFTLYPNPANDILNINAKQDIEIQSFAIYDTLGQLVIAIPNAKTVSNIDVSQLRTGNYFIKVKSDKGSSNMKFIKK
ncbi:T9SS type A sorting domain-containing protein [Flavobacterium sp. CSZ]|uniref:T9SS type A sorting domain-containing protein n=1 Tax=Flavobacterium sp. CSZ TaxID=2783791 RepID=UPI001889D02B|nr:T9SS type A sorting domain-containing protein [Flavobacterium sp. CSZ]MBF4487056.1 T9SS type A sorting domain-containing protein [Flavobacterium sp. CSZ]